MIPMHYDTFDLIKSDADDYVRELKERGIEALRVPFNETVDV